MISHLYQFVFVIGLIVLLTMICLAIKNATTQENFDATGLVYNQYPNWFQKKPYNMGDWITPVNPDRISAECLPYDQESKWESLENLNYLSQAYRFWRF